jgi:hypothetical protein
MLMNQVSLFAAVHAHVHGGLGGRGILGSTGGKAEAGNGQYKGGNGGFHGRVSLNELNCCFLGVGG